MRASLFSPSWYRVASLKPRLRSHVQIHRHVYRDELWYVFQDHASGRFQRFNPPAYLLIGLMDGERTVEEIWQAGLSRLGEEAPTQEEVIRILSQLHSADALQTDVPSDTLELFKRFEKRQGVKWKQNIRNPLAMRFSLFDPEKLLTRCLPIASPLFGWASAFIWLAVVATGVVLAGLHWPELTDNITDRILAPKNLLIVWFTFPFLKILHEFGHAFTVKKLGGEVHEVGIMFLVLTPLPYVDASSSLAFRSKWERILVGAVGIGIELFIASLALAVWVNIEPGALRSLMYNIIVMGGVSSILFNGNPLLRYDGYYILADLLEIPNLAQRGGQYMIYLAQRYLFGLHEVEPPVSTPGERAWFVIYTVLSLIYRIFIYASIVQFIAGKFLTLGLVIAMWAVVSIVGIPLYKAGKFLLSSPLLGHRRRKAVVVSLGCAAAFVAFVTLVPFPLGTVAEGVLSFPEDSFARARTEGFIEGLVAAPGSKVKRGELLATCSDPLLTARIKVLESRLQELEVQYDVNERNQRVKAQVTMEDIKQVRQELDDARTKAQELAVYSQEEGTFYVPEPQDLPGRFLKRGDVLGYVLNDHAVAARVVVYQPDVDLVRSRTYGVKVRMAERITKTLPSALIREVPAATDQLPGKAVGQEGGGGVAIDPRDQKGLKAFQKVFLFDIQVPSKGDISNVGGRVYVRFDHGSEPLAGRWYRQIRQLLLKRFNV